MVIPKNFHFGFVRYFWVPLFLLFLFLGSGCRRSKEEMAAHKIMVAGSTSVQPIAEKLAEHYMEKHPECKIEVQGGGSSAGIQAARSGAADIGTSSRELKADEKELKETVIAYDAIVIIVHPSNLLDNLTMENLRDIFSRKIKDWQELDPSHKGEITMITREEGSGTRGTFEELVMKQAEITDRCLVQDSTGAVREIVSSDPNAIGYISFGALNEKVKPLSVEGIPPIMENMITNEKAKKYRIIRPFLFVSKEAPSGLSLQFIRYIKSPEGAKLLQQEGLIPTHD